MWARPGTISEYKVLGWAINQILFSITFCNDALVLCYKSSTPLSCTAVRLHPSLKAQTHYQLGCSMFGSTRCSQVSHCWDFDVHLTVLLR